MDTYWAPFHNFLSMHMHSMKSSIIWMHSIEYHQMQYQMNLNHYASMITIALSYDALLQMLSISLALPFMNITMEIWKVPNTLTHYSPFPSILSWPPSRLPLHLNTTLGICSLSVPQRWQRGFNLDAIMTMRLMDTYVVS